MKSIRCILQTEYDIVITMFGPTLTYSETKLLTVKLF